MGQKKKATAPGKEDNAAVTSSGLKSKESKSKPSVTEMKVPKHVREIQAELAKRKEYEERKAREEEETRKKEEEERKKLEELERQAAEARRRKKEMEKEKRLKKKQEGKLLTGKQKEGQKQLVAMRNQILSKPGIDIPAMQKGDVSVKRPIYQTKKRTLTGYHVSSVASSKEEESEKDEPTVPVEDGYGLEEHDGIDNEGDWDVKSWDNLNLSAFRDEEVEFGLETVLKNEIKNTIDTAASSSRDKSITAATINAPALDTTFLQGEEELRSPICCILGHVDAGKTRLLDHIRGTNVQASEAGGITQQIGATYIPSQNIRDRTKELKADAKMKVPGLLVIDTPGHAEFSNLRSRGSDLCDVAILVVDIMNGLEAQTIDSLKLMLKKDTKFIVALNKVDRLYGWRSFPNAPIRRAMKQQSDDVRAQFKLRVTEVITEFKKQGINTELYYKNKDMEETYSIVPMSAISGEGIPDLLLLLVLWTQNTMIEKLTFSAQVQCSVLEVKVTEGYGTTIDVILINGKLHEGDQIVLCGWQGSIVTKIRVLLAPLPMKEHCIKGTYINRKTVTGVSGIKIAAQGLENAIAGTDVYVVRRGDDMELFKEKTMEVLKSLKKQIEESGEGLSESGEGVCVKASNMGSLEVLHTFLKSQTNKIPVGGSGIGPVDKKDVVKASVMLEKKKEFATILAFDVNVTAEARELANKLGVKIFSAGIIYHLFDQFKAYIDNLKEEKKKEVSREVVFPCLLEILPEHVFKKKDPIILGVKVVKGRLKVGTPICCGPQRDFMDLGRVASIEIDHKPVDCVKRGETVAIKIVGTSTEEKKKMFGRHFEIKDELVSHVTRTSLDILKSNYADDISNEEWKLAEGLCKLRYPSILML